MRIYKDYFLEGEVLLKTKLKESSHLLWSFGGVPALDAQIWQEYKDKIKEIRILTDKKRTFAVSAETFDANKELINLGYGNQYILDKSLWNIKEPTK